MEWRASQVKSGGQLGKVGSDMWDVIFGAISIRSFSALWYWVAVAVFWGGALGWGLGLPYGMVAQAQRSAPGMARLEAAALAQANYRAQGYMPAKVALAFAGLAMVTVLAFFYGIELALALWFIAAPMLLIWGLGLRAAQQILGASGQGDALIAVMYRLRLYTQIIGFVFIFMNIITAFLYMLSQGQLG